MWKIICKILNVSSETPKDNRVMWVDVPMTCKSREDKYELISKLIIDLERKIKII